MIALALEKKQHLRNRKKSSNAFTLPSRHNSLPLSQKKNNQVTNTTPHEMYSAEQNTTTSHAYNTGTAQSKQITTFVKLPTHSKP